MKALTGNLLQDGEAVFWRDGQWVPRFADAQLFDDEPAAEAAEAHAKSELTIVVDPYLTALVESEGQWPPLSSRGRTRCLGPATPPQHGKQALGGADIDALKHA